MSFPKFWEADRESSEDLENLSVTFNRIQNVNKLLADCGLDQSGYCWTSLVVKRNSWKETNKKGQTSVEG